MGVKLLPVVRWIFGLTVGHLTAEQQANLKDDLEAVLQQVVKSGAEGLASGARMR